MKKLCSLLLLMSSFSFADRLGSLRSSSDLILSTQAIQNRTTLQSGSTFYVSSGTVASLNSTNMRAQTISLSNTSGNFVSTIQDNGTGSNGNLLFGVSEFAAPLTLDSDLSIGGNTVGGKFSFTGPSQSTVTYGLAVGSLTITGIGAGEVDFTEGTAPTGIASSDVLYADSTDHALKVNNNNGTAGLLVISTSVVTVGHVALFGSSGSVVDGGALSAGATPGGSSGQLQYNGTGTLAGLTSVVTTSSITIVRSSFSFTTNGSQNVTTPPGSFDFYDGSGYAGKPIATFGNQLGSNQVKFLDHLPSVMAYGVTGGDLQLGYAANANRIGTIQSSNNFLDIYNGGGVTGQFAIQTGAAVTRDIVFYPETVETVRISSNSFVIKSSAAIVSPITDTYILRISTTTTQYQVTVSTNGALGLFSRTIAQLATIIPNAVGQQYYCSDCTTDAVCVSSQAVTANWARTSAKATACQ